MKLALAMIVKGEDREAELLDRCLENMSPYMDGIFITSTHNKGEKPNKKVDKVCKKYKANVSYFEWINDFSAARNFNFSQVPKDFDYIMWSDSDDVWRGIEKLRDTIESNPTVDAFAFWYMYEFDQYKQANTVHKKSMIVRNDNCVKWVGALHEDFKENRQMEVKFVEGIERMHLTDDTRALESRKRNIVVAKHDLEMRPNDPTATWNLANAYFGLGKKEEARETFTKFIKESGSEEEIYLALLRLAEVEWSLENREECIKNCRLALGMRPDYPDAYNQLGMYFYHKQNHRMAEYYLRNGLLKKPPYHAMIVHNPRDYDYNPMMLLAKVYFAMDRPEKALTMLEGCLLVYPDMPQIKTWVKDMREEKRKMDEVVAIIAPLQDETDKKKIKEALDKVPAYLRSHPGVTSLRNKHFVKETSSGKDLVYYCGNTDHVWNPEMAKTKGIGGSEEAVINLAKQWAKMGWNVTVYNNCGTEPMTCDGVSYRPFWEYNVRDKQDILIIWRWPKVLDYELKVGKVYLDLHDVIPAGELTPKRLEKLDKIFVKTKSHRILFPNVPNEKMAVVPNGMDFGLFNKKIKKDKYLMVNTSSPDRSMDVLPKLFKRVKAQVPQARLKWAYGFDIFDISFSADTKMQEWKKKVIKDMEEAGIENCGRLSQDECAKLYLEGSILAYPSEFYEIDCISVKKAQACGCKPITTDFAAFDESVQHGIKVHSPKTKDNWARDYQISYGIEDEKVQDAWVKAVVKELKREDDAVQKLERDEMSVWSYKFDWSLIAKEWSNTFNTICE